MGGNFIHASPDTEVTSDAMRQAALTVQVSTKLNRSHLVCGETALILPTKGRTEKDFSSKGEQYVSVEDSMSSVHASRGPLEPASPMLRSEVAIIAGIARGDPGRQLESTGRECARTTGSSATTSRGSCRAATDYSAKVDRPGGFVLPHPPRDSRTFETTSGLAEFAVSPIEVLQVPDGHLLLQTLRSHDQFNTTIYGLSDRYRGIEDGRRVIFVHPDDITALGFNDADMVDLVARWDDDDIERVAEGFRIVAYDTPRGSAAAYYPETNPLVPLDSTAIGSNTPTSKSVIISLAPAGQGRTAAAAEAAQDSVGADEPTSPGPSRRTCPSWRATPEQRRRCRPPTAARDRRPAPAG